ncbi:MAG: SMP-30/gluconolactonase/LRE family protein [Anaerolineaceae bacterium]|nr:SMP-30/gluconolactonase/LRE family protein [Anaerolineaceae bacterium]
MNKVLNVFWSGSEHRIRAAWRLMIEPVLRTLFMALAIIPIVIVVVVVLIFQRQAIDMNSIMSSPILLYGNAFVGLIGVVPSIWIVGRWIDRRKFNDFGFHFNRNWWFDFGFGLLLGAVLMALLFWIELQAGWISIREFKYVQMSKISFLPSIVLYVFLFTTIGFYEELLSRGYHVKNLSEGLNVGKKHPKLAIWLAISASSIVFGLMHATNPNATVMSTLNIAAAGIFLGLGYILTGELAISIGLHITWNFFQGVVFGFPVSGMTMGANFIRIRQAGSDVWTGGAFGPEAGYIGLLAMLLGYLLIVVYVWLRYGRVRLMLSLAEYVPIKPLQAKHENKGVLGMRDVQAKLLYDATAALGEGPAWDARVKKLYWVNIDGAEVHVFNPETGDDRVIDLSNQFSHIGTIAPTSNSGKVMIAPDLKIALLDLATEEVEILAEVEGKNERFNDGKCGPVGNFVVGTMHASDPLGKLYNYNSEAGVVFVQDGVKTSNGLGWSPDYRTMYYVDSKYKEVYVFDYDLETGMLSNKRVAFKLPEGDYSPDGLTTDKEGMIWLAWWKGFCVTRWNPETGEMIGKVAVPAPQVTACCFGGDEMKTLYITTARTGLGEETLAKYPHAGSLFVLETDVEGQPTWEFKF